ncbi:unnamed protein product [Owenia fusiformis]|uniref:Large ribosomal subunit protein uL22m n=1 Tax=Owenia fusiformis TaxID=6347 RepID=A0A8J1XMB3_OWEFU|nr:unnamed protein product [Owenia fusiformis]
MAVKISKMCWNVLSTHPRAVLRQVPKCSSMAAVSLQPQCSAPSLTSILASRDIHTCTTLHKQNMFDPKFKYLKYNKIVYPPQEEGEPRRPAEVTYVRSNIKYSPDKLWYMAIMIRGMSIDEALKQLSFHKKKGAMFIREALLEAQEEAVSKHNVEYKSNLWIEDSNVGKAFHIKGIRRHARMRYGFIQFKYCHYFVRLREGKPPKHYLAPPETGHQKMKNTLQEHRNKRVFGGL